LSLLEEKPVLKTIPLVILLAYARLVEIPVEQIIDDEIELTV